MKKIFIVAVFIVVFTSLTPLYAQRISEGKESEYYYFNVAIEKVYPYRAGYIVLYRKGANRIARTFIPADWFTDPAGKADLVILPKGSNWPSLSVYYRNGEFSHIRMFLHWWKGHATWGNVPQNVNLDSYFEDIESIELEF